VKIALAQMKVIPGSLDKNLKNMVSFVNQAKQLSADLIVFPEMCAQGYLVGDKWLCDDFCRSSTEIEMQMRSLSEGIAIAWGSVYLDEQINERTKSKAYHPNKDGRIRRYNCVNVVQNKKDVPLKLPSDVLPQGKMPKTLLPNYRFFDDERYFTSLKDVARDFNLPVATLIQPFLIKDAKGQEIPIGFQICEDMWAKDYRDNFEALNVTQMAIDNGAEYIVNLSASPWTFGKNQARDRRIKFLYQENPHRHIPFFYVNCVGVQNNGKNFISFDGGSTIYNALGESIQQAARPFEPELLFIDTQKIAQSKTVIRKTRTPIAEKFDAIIQAIRSLNELRHIDQYPKFVIGLSGGVDSAVVAALLVKAVGPEHVVAVNMPSQWNSSATQNAAQYVADQLGIVYLQIPIETMVDAIEESLQEYVLDKLGQAFSITAKENIQAKTRGTDVLSNIAGNAHWLFTNNGNKLEIALGYATLYGDVGGAIAPIGDLLKTEVFSMAHFLNDHVYHSEVIPKVLLPDDLYRFSEDQIKPSAELKANQEDPMKFGYHDALLQLVTDYHKWSEEKIIRAYQHKTLHRDIAAVLGQEAGYGLALMQRWGVDRAEVFVSDLRWFIAAMGNNVFKRVQAPGIVITSRSAYGFDIRESMLPYYESEALKQLRQSLEDYQL